MGVEAAYKAVMKPTEGTILTVSRMAAERARVVAKTNTDAIAVWEEIVREAEAALEQTPEMLPVLKKAGVVDAGGKGLLIVFEGMLSVLRDGIMIEDTQPKGGEGQETDDFQDAIAQYDADITFAYCTEFIVQKKEPNADSLKLRAYLESIGDSVVVVDDEDIIKCHVHTNNPGLALEEAVRVRDALQNEDRKYGGTVCRPKISGQQRKIPRKSRWPTSR